MSASSRLANLVPGNAFPGENGGSNGSFTSSANYDTEDDGAQFVSPFFLLLTVFYISIFLIFDDIIELALRTMID